MLCYISHKDETWQSYILPKDYEKSGETHILNSAAISIFCWKSTIFVVSGNKDKNFIVIHNP